MLQRKAEGFLPSGQMMVGWLKQHCDCGTLAATMGANGHLQLSFEQDYQDEDGDMTITIRQVPLTGKEVGNALAMAQRGLRTPGAERDTCQYGRLLPDPCPSPHCPLAAGCRPGRPRCLCRAPLLRAGWLSLCSSP